VRRKRVQRLELESELLGQRMPPEDALHTPPPYTQALSGRVAQWESARLTRGLARSRPLTVYTALGLRTRLLRTAPPDTPDQRG
jgi:hypothetical protein